MTNEPPARAVSADHILVSATDDAFAAAAAVALLSAAVHCRQRPPCLIIDCGISTPTRAWLHDTFALRAVPLTCRAVDGARFSDLPLSAHLTAATYARLAAAELAGDLAARSLYLDADTLTVAAVDPLLDADLGGHAAGAVQDPKVRFVSRPGGVTGWRRLGIPAATAHFNAGVLLIDNAAWRAEGVSERALELLRSAPEEATFADQGALNGALAGRWMPLAERWNVAVPRSAGVSVAGRVISRHAVVALGDLGILHFSGLVKPWQPDYAPSPYRRRYSRALATYAPAAEQPRYDSVWRWARTRR